MPLYQIALFLHIAGALGIIAALAIEWTGLSHLVRAATAEQVQEWSGITLVLRRLGPVSMVLLLVPGMYMAATGWRGTAWPWIGLAAMLFLPALGAPSGVRLGRVQRAAAGERGPLSGALRQQLRHPLLNFTPLVLLLHNSLASRASPLFSSFTALVPRPPSPE